MIKHRFLVLLVTLNLFTQNDIQLVLNFALFQF